MTLMYTLNKLMEKHRAQLERDTATPDEFGAKSKRLFVLHATVPCDFWWWHGGTGRGYTKEIATEERTIDITGGGLIVAKGTDVSESKDRIGDILTPGGTIIADGPFRIVGVHELERHLELFLERP